MDKKALTSTSIKIFLDSGDPDETRGVIESGFRLDGQTTNPSLVAKNHEIKERIEKGSLSEEELLSFYKDIVNDIHKVISDGSISIEVYADNNSTAEDLIAQGKTMATWLPNPHIKLPITKAGLKAARALVNEGYNVNMTLCFSQQQAVAVHLATQGAKPGQVYVSPFIGRLDDKGKCGLDVIDHIVTHYKSISSHVSVLAASIRSIEHVEELLKTPVDIVTIPKNIFDVIEKGAAFAESSSVPKEEMLTPIPFEEIDYESSWEDLDIAHELTDAGLLKFASDWNALLGKK